MRINSRPRIWLFAVSVTFVALVLSEGMNLLFYPPGILVQTMTGTAVIAIMVAMPVTLWVGEQMHRNATLSRKLQDLVERDRLTDVATRDFFFSRLELDPNAFGASLMIDIDHFKQVNDTFGHLAGDAVIRAVAGVLKAKVRAEDIVCRFGGEEFVVFLHEATPEEAWTIAERIRSGIEQASITGQDGPIQVTVSVGGSLKEQIEHIDESIRRADGCLYEAKALGRNRTVVDWLIEGYVPNADPPPDPHPAAERQRRQADAAQTNA